MFRALSRSSAARAVLPALSRPAAAPAAALPRQLSRSLSTATGGSAGSFFFRSGTRRLLAATLVSGAGLAVALHASPQFGRLSTVEAATFSDDINTPASELPVIDHPVVFAPNVPAPITRKHRAVVKVNFESTVIRKPIRGKMLYEFWTFNDQVPGPFIRCRVGDVLQLSLTNKDKSGMMHNVDFHAVTGPGGGAELLNAETDETRTASFKLLHPGLFFYHCAVGPVPVHVANGMYGLILVEPKEGLPKVDKEFYVLQSELYFEKPEPGVARKPYDHGHGGGKPAEPEEETDEDRRTVDFSYQDGLDENPKLVVFNGRDGALRDEGTLQVKQNERVRIFFGNGGPNLISSFHVIGTIFDKVYREGDLISPPARSLQTTAVPAGGAAVVEIDFPVPGNFTLVDHSLFRLEKGAVGFIRVTGEPRPEIFHSVKKGKPCPNCNIHP